MKRPEYMDFSPAVWYNYIVIIEDWRYNATH